MSPDRNARVMKAHRVAALVALLPLVSCKNDLHPTGADTAPAVNPPNTVSVTVEYTQPNGCLDVQTPCDEPVVFFASWMRPGNEFRLTKDPTTFIWRGTATGVPVNWPPRDAPYSVRIFDPYLRESITNGFTADRIRLGGESLTTTDGGGGADQVALVYVDDNGKGHNPY